MPRDDYLEFTLPESVRLEAAFRRAGWSKQDVWKLTERENLTKVLQFVKSGCEVSIPPGMRLAPIELVAPPKNPAQLKALRKTDLESVFSVKTTRELGYSVVIRTRVLKVKKDGRTLRELGELLDMSEEEFLDLDMVGRTQANYVRDVLARLGLTFR